MAHKRTRKRIDAIDSELSMTPMIDIVFQLLIYFILTFQPEDVMAHLDVFRPQPDPNQIEQPPKPQVLEIVIYPNGYTVNEREMSLAGMERALARLAEIDNTQTVLIKATAHSLHENLIKVLDLCAKVGMRNLSVVSTN
jgi:biopolymer transport protein ExbD